MGWSGRGQMGELHADISCCHIMCSYHADTAGLLGYRVWWMAEPAQLGDLDARLERLDAALKAQDTSLAVAWTLLTGFSIFFMQTGFTLLEVGALRAASIRHILVKNLTALTLVAICWLPWGYCMAYGTTGDTFRECLRNAASFQPFQTARTFQTFGLAAACNSVALGAVAERFALRGYDRISAGVVAGLSSCGQLELDSLRLMRSVGFHDAAGSVVVFLTGGMLGLVAAWRVGARFGRFVAPIPANVRSADRRIQAKATPAGAGRFPGDLPGAPFYSFNCHAGQVTVDEGFTRAPQIALVTTVAAAYAGLADLFWQGFRNRWLVHCGKPKQLFAVDAVSNSILTGLAAIAAGCDVASFWSAAVVGVVAVPVRRGLAYCLLQSGVDDPLEVGGVFCGGGLWGVLAVGILPNTTGLPQGTRPLFVAQLLGGLLAMAFAGAVGLVVFGLLHFLEQHCDSVRLLRRDFKKECWKHKEEEFRNNMKDLLKATMALLAEPEEEIPDHVVQRMGFQTQATREWRMFVQSVYADLPRLLDAHHLSKSDFCKACRKSSSSYDGHQQSPTEDSVSLEMDNMLVGQGQGLGNKLPHAPREASFERYSVNGRKASERCSVNGQEAVCSPSEHSLPSSDKLTVCPPRTKFAFLSASQDCDASKVGSQQRGAHASLSARGVAGATHLSTPSLAQHDPHSSLADTNNVIKHATRTSPKMQISLPAMSLPLPLHAIHTPDGQRTPELIYHNYHQPMTRLGINQDDTLQSQIHQLTGRAGCACCLFHGKDL
eukprot:g48739.t1